MPQSRGNTRAEKRAGRGRDIGLGAVAGLTEFVGVLCGALAAMSLLGFAGGVWAGVDGGALLLYTLCFGINAAVFAASRAACGWLRRRDETLAGREAERRAQELEKSAGRQEG